MIFPDRLDRAGKGLDEMDGQLGSTQRGSGIEDRLDAIGWGVLLIVVGGVLLTPGLPPDAWLVAAGVVMLGTTVVRQRLGLVIPWTTVAIGTVAIVGGGAGILGFGNAGLPLILIALGMLVAAVGIRGTSPNRSGHSIESVGRS